MMTLVPRVTKKPLGLIVTLSKEYFPVSPPFAVSRACIHTYCIPVLTSCLLFMPRGKKLVPKFQQGRIVRSHHGFFPHSTLQVSSLATSKFSSFTKSKYMGCNWDTTQHWSLWDVLSQIQKCDRPSSVARTTMLNCGSLISLDMSLLIFPPLDVFCGLFCHVMEEKSEGEHGANKRGVAGVCVNMCGIVCTCMWVCACVACMYAHALHVSMHVCTCRYACK